MCSVTLQADGRKRQNRKHYMVDVHQERTSGLEVSTSSAPEQHTDVFQWDVLMMSDHMKWENVFCFDRYIYDAINGKVPLQHKVFF